MYCRDCKEHFYYEGYNFDANLYEKFNRLIIKVLCQENLSIVACTIPLSYDLSKDKYVRYSEFEEYIKSKGESHEN